MVTPSRPPRFFRVGTDEAETAGFLEHLEAHGYAVAASVASPAEVERAKDLMWDFLEGGRDGRRPTGVDRAAVETWGDFEEDRWRRRWPGDAATGILSSSGVGHAPFMWHLRLLPAVSEAFAAIWGVGADELLTSFDGANVFRPWLYRKEWKTIGGWYHIDQNAYNSGKEGRCCVQGLITLTDADETTGGLVVVPGSHKHFTGVCERNAPKPRKGQRGELMNFVRLAEGDEAIADGGRLVCADAGDLIVWDSRTVHCNTPMVKIPALPADGVGDSTTLNPPLGGWTPIRMAAYVCMTPASWATDDVLEKRWDAFVNNQTTTHWPHTFAGGTARPDLPKNDPKAISERQRRLIGGGSEIPSSIKEDVDLARLQKEARRLDALAVESESSGDCAGAIRLYKQAYKLDPSLEIPADD